MAVHGHYDSYGYDIIHGSDHTSALIFLLKQWQHELELGETLIALLSWSDCSF